MSKKHEKNIYLANLAEQCGKYNDMIQLLEDIIKSTDKDLNSNERGLLSIAYKNLISSGRNALRVIQAYEAKYKKIDSNYINYILEYKKQIEDELTKRCQHAIKTINDYLLKKVEDEESKLFYIKMKGDYNRYIAEYAEGDLKQLVSDEASKAYNETVELVKKLPGLNPIALGTALSYSVFYHDIYNDNKKAIDIAKAAIEKADKEFSNIEQNDCINGENPPYVSIYNILKENLDTWIDEEKEKNK